MHVIALKWAKRNGKTTMENLSNPKAYLPQVVARIESMGPIAISIANRWMLGWPDRVAVLLKTDSYLDCLESQLEQEKEILACEANLRHLTRREILEIYEIKDAPPTLM